MFSRGNGAEAKRGQTATEYAGVLLLVAAIIGALLVSGAGGRVVDEVEQAICQIASLGEGDCGGSSPDDPGDPDDPDDPAQPPERTPRDIAEAGDYVAIGDSFSSGEGAYDYDPDTDRDENRCHRSQNAYPERIADEFDFQGDVTVVTCSGARTRNVGETEEHGTPEGQYGEDPQLDAITDDTSLVTLGIGGNDAEWTDVIINCMSDLGSDCQNNEDAVRQNMEDAADAVLEIYLEARERAPDDARVIGVGYPRFFPEPPTDDLFDVHILCSPFGCAKRVGLNPAEQAWMNGMFREFNDMLGARAAEAGIEFVDMYDVFDGHEYGSDDPYMNALVTDWPDWSECGLSDDGIKRCLESAIQSETAHPNAAGQAAMAERVAEQVESG